jgi:hypothetical protein
MAHIPAISRTGIWELNLLSITLTAISAEMHKQSHNKSPFGGVGGTVPGGDATFYFFPPTHSPPGRVCASSI